MRMLKQILFKLIPRIRYDDMSAYAAQISFYLLMSLFPLLILLVTALTQMQLLDVTQLMEVLRRTNIFPDAALSVIEEVLGGVTMPSSSIPFYILVVLWSASRGTRAIMNGVHMAFRTTFHWFFLMSGVVQIIRYLVPLGFLIIIYTLLYKFIPPKDLKFRDVLPGSFFAALGSFLISQGFSLYTGHFGNYSALYGSIAGIIVFCTWMYLFSFIMVLGAEINACIYEIMHNTSLLKIH